MRALFRILRDTKCPHLLLSLTMGFVFLTLRDVLFAFALGDALDSVITGSTAELHNAIGQLALAALISIPFQVWVSFADNSFGARSMKNFLDKHIGTILNLPYSYFVKHHSADIGNRFVGDMMNLHKFLNGQLGYLICMGTYSVATILCMLFVNVQLTVIGYLIIPIVLYGVSLVTKKMAKRTIKSSKANAKALSIAQDVLYAQESIKLYRIPKYFRKRFADELNDSANTQIVSERSKRFAYGISGFSQTLPDLLVGLFGVFLVLKGEITYGTILVFVQLSGIGMAFIRHCGMFFSQVREAAGTSERIYEVLDQAQERKGGKLGTDTQHVLRMDNVDFSYSTYKACLPC